MRLKIVLLIVLLPQILIAQQPKVRGYDLLGLAKYCDTYLKSPNLDAVSTLMSTFGNPLPCIEKKIKKDGLKLVQVDLIDATCVRNNKCPEGSPSITDWKVVANRTKQVNALAVKYPQVEWWVSPYLEHDIKDEKIVVKACQVIKENCPTCKCINSPFSGATPKGIPVERHGTKVSAFSISSDGASMFDADNIKNDGNKFQHRNSGNDQTYGWWNEANGRCTGEKTFTPPLKRTAWPEDWQLKMAHKILTTEEDVYPRVPPTCKNVRHVNAMRGEIVKPTAERYCNGQPNEKDLRGNRPLLILTKPGKKGDKIKVYKPDGKEVGCFSYYDSFTTPGTYRWYMGNCSGQNPWELYTDLNQEWGYVHLGQGNCLRFNSIRREGVYR